MNFSQCSGQNGPQVVLYHSASFGAQNGARNSTRIATFKREQDACLSDYQKVNSSKVVDQQSIFA